MCSEKNAKRKEILHECVSLEGSHVPCYNNNLKYFYFSWKEDEKTSSPISQLLNYWDSNFSVKEVGEESTWKVLQLLIGWRMHLRGLGSDEVLAYEQGSG